MKYVIEYEEKVRRINSITIEVNNEDQGEKIADKLYEEQENFDHPDCIFEELHSMGIKILGTLEGAESCEYEIQ